MDVQSAVATSTDPSLHGAPFSAPTLAPPPVALPDPGDPAATAASANPGGVVGSNGTASLTAKTGASHAAAQPSDARLSDAVGKLFGSGGEVTVSYKVEKPDEIVTIFTDAGTGQVIAQFPSEIMIRMAQFFQQLAGAVLDKKA